jgi:hypothetical protein
VPAAFTLLLSRFGHPRYSCRVVWRSHDSLGVMFVAN